MHRGYIKIWRKIEDSGLYQMPNTLALFMFLLSKAMHKDCKVGTATGIVELKRGQYISGRLKLSSDLNQSEREIRTSLSRLIELQIIDQQTTSKYSIYTIVNYSNYQDSDQQTTSTTTSRRPADDQQTTTKEECKELKECKEETKPSRKRSAMTIQEYFSKCEAEGVKRIPEDDPVFDYADKIGIELEMVKVCWGEFVRTHAESKKRQSDWRSTFRNYVRKNYYKLWYVEADGSVKETPQYRALKKIGDMNV